MGVDYRIVNRDAHEFVDFRREGGNDRTGGLLVGDLAAVAGLLAIRPAEDLDPLLGRWHGQAITVFGDSANGDLAAAGGDGFADDAWVLANCEDISPAVIVLLDRLQVQPIDARTLQELDAANGDTFLRFARCADVLGFRAVADLLDERVGNGWHERWKQRSEATVRHRERLGWEPSRYQRWASQAAQPGPEKTSPPSSA